MKKLQNRSKALISMFQNAQEKNIQIGAKAGLNFADHGDRR